MTSRRTPRRPCVPITTRSAPQPLASAAIVAATSPSAIGLPSSRVTWRIPAAASRLTAAARTLCPAVVCAHDDQVRAPVVCFRDDRFGCDSFQISGRKNMRVDASQRSPKSPLAGRSDLRPGQRRAQAHRSSCRAIPVSMAPCRRYCRPRSGQPLLGGYMGVAMGACDGRISHAPATDIQPGPQAGIV